MRTFAGAVLILAGAMVISTAMLCQTLAESLSATAHAGSVAGQPPALAYVGGAALLAAGVGVAVWGATDRHRP